MTTAQPSFRYLIIGAGIQSEAVADLLLGINTTAGVTFADRDDQALARVKRRFGKSKKYAKRTGFISADASDIDAMAELMALHDASIGCASYKLNVGLTRAAIGTATHFVDLGGNDSVVAEQFALADDAKREKSRILPDCGIAPGAAGILVRFGLGLLPSAKSVRVYCGGLPQHPVGPLKYALFFSPTGLINE